MICASIPRPMYFESSKNKPYVPISQAQCNDKIRSKENYPVLYCSDKEVRPPIGLQGAPLNYMERVFRVDGLVLQDNFSSFFPKVLKIG